MRTKVIYIVMGVSLINLLSSCASLNSNFDCSIKPGVMCKSLDQVNIMVDQGKLGNSAETASKDKKALMTDIDHQEGFIEPVRTHEKIARIWIAPYVDNEGDYYGATTVYHLIKPSDWSDKPMKLADV